MVARRTPHLNSASGLDATKWCKNARSLLRRSDTTSGRMCSAFFCRKSWRTRRTTINMLHTFTHTEGATVFSGEGSALIVHLFRMFKDFPTAVSVTLTVIRVNLLKFKWKNLIDFLEKRCFHRGGLYSTLIWYLTLPAKCWMTKVSSVFEEGTKNGLSRCCCFNLSNRVSSVASGMLEIHKGEDRISISTHSVWERQQHRSTVSW